MDLGAGFDRPPLTCCDGWLREGDVSLFAVSSGGGVGAF